MSAAGLRGVCSPGPGCLDLSRLGSPKGGQKKKGFLLSRPRAGCLGSDRFRDAGQLRALRCDPARDLLQPVPTPPSPALHLGPGGAARAGPRCPPPPDANLRRGRGCARRGALPAGEWGPCSRSSLEGAGRRRGRGPPTPPGGREGRARARDGTVAGVQSRVLAFLLFFPGRAG